MPILVLRLGTWQAVQFSSAKIFAPRLTLEVIAGKDPLDRELQQISASASVEAELAALKDDVQPPAKKSLTEGQS